MPAHVGRFRQMLWLGAGCALLAGCGAHFYDAGRDATAQAAKKSYEDAKVLDVIVTERANLVQLLDLELDVVARHLAAVVRAEWFRLVDSTQPLSTSLMERGVGRRLAQLGLGNADDGVLADVAVMKIVNGTLVTGKAIEAADIIRLRFKVSPPSCPEALRSPAVPEVLVAAAKNQLSTMQVLWDEYRQACVDPAQANIPAGPLKLTFDEMQRARARIETERNERQKAQAALDKALKEFEAAATPVPTETAAFNQRVDSLRALLDQLATTAGGLGVEAAAAERLKALDVLLRATAGEQVDATTLTEPEVKKAVLVAATSRALTDEARSIAASRRAPPVSGLLIEKQRQEALKAAAARRVQRAERRLRLYEDRFEALVHEVYLLQRARVAAKAVPGVDPLAKPLSEALGEGDIVGRRQAYLTVFHYLDSMVTARRRQEETDYRLIALDHEEAVDASETAIALWNGLIATPVNQLAAYHASGLKAEQIAALLVQFIGLGSIGVGVNR